MITLRIGNKSAFFFCGTVKLSRKSNPEVSLKLEDVAVSLAKGLLKGLTSGALQCEEDTKKIIEEIAKKEIIQESVIESIETTKDETPAVEVSKEIEVAAPAPKAPRQKRAQAKVDTKQD